MRNRLLNRRDFTGLCATALLSAGAMFPARSDAWARVAAIGAGAPAGRTIKFRDGTIVPALGQGLGVLERDYILRPLKKKRCAQAFPSG